MEKLKANIALKAAATLGEGPVWDEEIQKLYWVDIKEKTVFRYDPLTSKLESWVLDQMVGCLVPADQGRVICALQDRLVYLDTFSGKTENVISFENDKPDNRSNDGKADAAGRLWIGSLNIPGEAGKSALYSIDGKLTMKKEVGELGLSNGLGWSPDNKFMYLVDTDIKHVFQFDYSKTGGRIDNQRLLFDFSKGEGSPDGMTVDVNGNLWISFYAGKRVDCYDPRSKKQLATVEVPAVNVTCCTFGGPGLDTLYITTARDGVGKEDLEKFPDTGSLFSVKPGVSGFAANRFRRL